jgi:hypothetical protein
MKWPDLRPSNQRVVGFRCRPQGCLGVERDDRIERWVEAVDPVQVEVEQFPAADGLRADRARQITSRLLPELFGRCYLT